MVASIYFAGGLAPVESSFVLFWGFVKHDWVPGQTPVKTGHIYLHFKTQNNLEQVWDKIRQPISDIVLHLLAIWGLCRHVNDRIVLAWSLGGGADDGRSPAEHRPTGRVITTSVRGPVDRVLCGGYIVD